MIRKFSGLSIGAVAIVFALAQPATAGATAEELIEESRITVESMMTDTELPQVRQVVEKARGVLIVPELIKGGFIIGAEGGSGVLLVRGSDGSWSSPAFYTLVAGSIGLQIGGQIAEVIFALMNDGAVEAFLGNEFKLGADLSIAVGPLGRGVEVSTTTNLDKDIYAYSRVVGLFGGGSLEGAKIMTRQDLNDAYYGAVATARDIVIERKFFNREADALRKALP